MEADTAEVARARFAISAETFALLSYIALAALFLIVVSGATVRLTGSGLGCENWPRCGSSFLPEKNFHALVEYGNRGVGFETHPLHAKLAFLVADDEEFQVLQVGLARLRFRGGNSDVMVAAHFALRGIGGDSTPSCEVHSAIGRSEVFRTKVLGG